MASHSSYPLRRRALLSLPAAAWLPEPASARADAPRRVLMLASQVSQLGRHRTGTFLKELAYPFQVFRDAGWQVDVGSVRGGPVALYDRLPQAEALARIETSEAFAGAVRASLPVAALRAQDYAALYLPGGHGQYGDLVGHAPTAAFALALHVQGGVIGSAGHGTACLVHWADADGRPFVAGKRMTCFPTWAERQWMEISDYGRLLPFDMQPCLQASGAELVLCTEATAQQREQILVTDEAQRSPAPSPTPPLRWRPRCCACLRNSSVSVVAAGRNECIAALRA
jgi:putative intracellular protease/amidase